MLKLQSKGWALFRNWQSDLQQSKKMTKSQIRFINPLFHVDWYIIITQKMLTFAFKCFQIYWYGKEFNIKASKIIDRYRILIRNWWFQVNFCFIYYLLSDSIKNVTFFNSMKNISFRRDLLSLHSLPEQHSIS